MNCKIFYVSILVFLAFQAISEGMSLKGLGVDPRCRCIETESRRFIKHIAKVELFPSSSHCKDVEIIATLKGTGQEICLDPTAPWVKRVVDKMNAKQSIMNV